MNCDSAVQLLPLYLYGELPPEEEGRLEEHLEGCPECSREIARQKMLHAALDRRAMEPEAALLAECRRNVARAVSGECALPVRPAGAWRRLREAVTELFASAARVRVPAGAVALVALGFLAGRFTGARPGPAAVAPDATIASVRSIQPDDSGRVRIALDETHRRTVSGNLEDHSIQQLLLAAARDENNPGVRVESMELLKDQAGSADVRRALLDAATRDDNAGVRMMALDGLKQFSSDPDVRRTLAQVLMRDDSAALRIRAVDMLTAHQDDSMVGVLQNVVQKEDNGYVRSRCERMLREMNASVGTF